MIGHIMNLVRWEWFKLRRRWMPWIILAVLLVYSQLGVWVNYLSYRTQPDGETYASFTLPHSIPSALNAACSDIGIILTLILTASVIGTEYQWGTLRPVLAKGTGRWQYLTSKVLLLWVLAVGTLLIIMAVTTASSLVAGALAGGAPEGSSVSARRVDVPIAFGKASFVLLPYMALAAFFTVLTTSWAAGMAISVVYRFAEQIASVVFVEMSKRLDTVVSYMLGRNADAWMIAGDARSIDIGETLITFPSGLHAFLVLMVYTLVLGGLAFWIFQRRDVAAK
jgi:ABC-type transport system involved in multi-copper enzyme maturation permease subunit